MRATIVLRPVGTVDEVVDRPFDRLEGDFLRNAGDYDPPYLLPHRSSIPTRGSPVVGPHVESVVDRNGPNSRRGAVCYAVLPQRRNVQIIGLSDLAQFVFLPCGHCCPP